MKTTNLPSLLFVLLLASCSVSSIEEFVVGENFVHDESGIVMIDTMTIKTSIVKFDSIISNSSGRLLAGGTYNTFSGFKNSNAFLEMTFTDNISYTNFVYDSLCMILTYDGYYAGDTTVTQTFSAHQLKEEMELNSNDEIYTTSQFEYNNVALGSVQLKPSPNSKKNLSIRLSDKLGNRLAQMIKGKNDTLTNTTLFKSFFKGLVIKTEKDMNGAAVGFKVSGNSVTDSNSSSGTGTSAPEIRLYYHLSPNPDFLSGLYYKFVYGSNGIYFNQISGNSSNSLLEGLWDSGNEINSNLTDNKIIVQAGIQTFSKIWFPHVANLLMIGQNSGVIAAGLRLYPVKGTYSNSADLPDSLTIYTADRKNKLTGQMLLPDGKTTAYVTKKVITDVEETVFYQADITSFIISELNEGLETNKSLFIGFGSNQASKSLDQIILGGPHSGKYSPEIFTYYYHN
jgi:hypothetical protein